MNVCCFYEKRGHLDIYYKKT